ncbi:hypothetical protein NCAST_11_00350 [Nocardia asteroides NBRC 15531]|uniref:AB hydrolase-1 domain-containing protein n=2 Tax=Nocardia asteroides TaxID=1824 RepID=U5E7X2_NOCAS|nr:hypothetical protein NCAST_11_00350 [Nocardia asteroides NBRC 15531]
MSEAIMSTHTPNFVGTALGRLHVEQIGSGPPALLWHSLFVDSRSWDPVLPALAAHRRLVVVDGPCHGRSGMPDHDFTLDDCAAAATEVLDLLGIDEPVDWVGNAWGGHVGLVLAATSPDRLRSVTTIGTPIQAISRRERRTKIVPLVALYRLVGPSSFVVGALTDSLLGTAATTAAPEQSALVMNAFRTADRPAMRRAMRSVMLNRPSLDPLLPTITTPTLMLAAADDPMGWHPTDAESATATMPNARSAALPGGGHIAPLLLAPDRLTDLIVDFWEQHSEQGSGPVS